jgi:alpha-methylacyl-CoA racemase
VGSQMSRQALSGVKVIEFANLAPVPFAGLLLGDLGAEVIRIDRTDAAPGPVVLGRSQRSIAVDLKAAAGRQIAQSLIRGCDVLIEGFRPGVMERLGLGPDDALALNRRLIYTRLTGWGQEGNLAGQAGHDINYIAVAGVLHQIGHVGERPTVPLNLVADFAGGGMLAVIGVLAALQERQVSGRGQVIDAAMVDGAALLLTWLHEMLAKGRWREERATNFLDGSAPYYGTYETADGKFVSVGAIEAQFYRQLLDGLGLRETELPPREDRGRWPELRAVLAARFKTRGRDDWAELFAGQDACVFPVLSPTEAAGYSDEVGRPLFIDVAGATQPRPAPRLSRSGPPPPQPAPVVGQDTSEILRELGYPASQIQDWAATGVIVAAQRDP